MGCFGGQSYGVAPQDTVVNDQMAALSREQYQDYIERFRPMEIEAIRENMDDSVITDAVGEARADANKAWDASSGVTDRALSDYGVTLDPDQMASRDRQTKQNRSASVADAQNTTRVMETDRRYQRGDDLFRTGRQVEGTATSQYGAAAQLEAARGRANADARTQASQAGANSRAGLAGTALGALGMFAFLSDEDLKHNIKDVSDKDALEDVKAIDVKTYNYKEETGLPQDTKIGGMRDDMPDYVKREGGAVDVQNSIGMMTSAIKALDQKISAIEARV